MTPTTQYVLPFDAAQNELIMQIAMLRDTDTGLSPGRLEGVVQLLERLTLLGNDLTERGGLVRVKAQVIAIAARVSRRATVADRTVRNWRADAEALGVLHVDITSHKFGRRNWNTYTIDVAAIRAWVSGLVTPKPTPAPSLAATYSPPVEAGNGRKWPETVAAPRAEMVAAPGAEMVAAPLNGKTNSKTPPPLSPTPSADQPSSEPHTDRDPPCDAWEVVVSELILLGMSLDGARGAVSAAQQRGLTHTDVGQLTERYRELSGRDAHVTVGWLHRWLTGRSRPPARASPVPRPDRSHQRGDALSRSAITAEAKRVQILRSARRRGLPEPEIAALCAAAGVEY